MGQWNSLKDKIETDIRKYIIVNCFECCENLSLFLGDMFWLQKLLPGKTYRRILDYQRKTDIKSPM